MVRGIRRVVRHSLSNKDIVAIPFQTKIMPIILVGLLSMFFAEVFSGSSQMWFLNPWALMMTFPLYLFHLLFYLNLALLTRRTSIPQLYLWGTLFALYEGPITKVLWDGYGDAAPVWGTVAGVGALEFPTLVFFWHPLLSFVLPILVFQLFAFDANRASSSFFQSNTPWLQRSKRTLFFFSGVALLGSLLLSYNSQFDSSVTLVTGIGSIALIVVAKKLASKGLSLQTLRLGRGGFIAVILYLVALYVVLWWIIYPEKNPGADSIATIAFFALLSGFLLWKSRPQPETFSGSSLPAFIAARDIYGTWIVFLILLVVWALIPQAALANVVLLTLPFIGAGFFCFMIVKVLTRH